MAETLSGEGFVLYDDGLLVLQEGKERNVLAALAKECTNLVNQLETMKMELYDAAERAHESE